MALFAAVPIVAQLGALLVSIIISLKGWLTWLVGAYFVGKIIKILISLGFGVSTYYLGEWALDNLYNYILSGLGQLPANLLGLITEMGIFEALPILFAALSVRLTVAGLTASGIITK